MLTKTAKGFNIIEKNLNELSHFLRVSCAIIIFVSARAFIPYARSCIKEILGRFECMVE